MRFAATMDTATRAITAGALAVWALSTGFVAWAIATTPDLAVRLMVAVTALPALAAVPLIGLWSPRGYQLDEAGLRILRRAGDAVVPLRAIREARPLDDGLRLRRVFGVGGLFGWYGAFSAAGLGRLTLHATRVSGRVALLTDQGTLVVTPDEPAAFLASLALLRAG